MYNEILIHYEPDELVPISALTQYAYCPRRCALIHIEQMWEENKFTAEGRIMHEHVHDEGDESRGDVRIERGASLRSLRLGLIEHGGLFLLSISGASPSLTIAIKFSYAHKRFVWKKC
jgi:CRISPR-associated exonuclease Cas4